MPHRIALAITDLDIGGAERCLTHLATRLDRRRFEPVVYCLQPRPARKEASCVPALEAAGIEVRFLDARRPWHLAGVIRRLRQALAGQRPDLIQTFLFHANLVGRIAARRAGVRRVISGIRVAEPGRRWRRWLEWATSGTVDCHVCPSQAVARFAETRMRLRPEKIAVIPNGVDLARYPAVKPAELATLGIKPGRRVVVCIARLDRQKGLRWLLRSAAGWLRQAPDCDLLLVGSGPLRQELEAIGRQEGIADRVFFAGWRADVPEILAASRLLVLPSVWEGMPNVVLEAMAGGLPVAASDVEGVRELLGPGAEEQTVPYGYSEALVKKVVRIMGDDALARRIGQENRRRVEDFFGLDAMVQAYQDLWEGLLRA